MMSVIFRKVEYLNAKGSFLDSHTIKAVLKNGTEVKKYLINTFIPKTNCHKQYKTIKKLIAEISNIPTQQLS